MNKILLATDFSNSAAKARDYAIELAEKTNAEVILLHAYSVDVLGSLEIYHEIYEDKKNKTGQLLEQLVLEFQSRRYEDGSGPINVKIASWVTDPLNEISEVIKNEHIDLVVLGNVGEEDALEFSKSDFLKKLIEIENVPVIVVPDDANGILFGKVVIGVELVPEDEYAIRQLLDLLKGIPVEITVLHLFESDHHHVEAEKFEQLKIMFKDESTLNFLAIRYPKLNDPEYSLNKYVNENELDLLVLVKHKRNFLEGLFHKSAIHELVAYTHVPILIIS